MKNKNLIVIFLSGVYQYVIPMLLYVLLPRSFLLGVKFLYKK